jgi:hypothetical protein
MGASVKQPLTLTLVRMKMIHPHHIHFLVAVSILALLIVIGGGATLCRHQFTSSATDLTIGGANRSVQSCTYPRCEFFVFFSFDTAIQRGSWPAHSRGFKITHNDAPHTVGLLWTIDQSVAETST